MTGNGLDIELRLPHLWSGGVSRVVGGSSQFSISLQRFAFDYVIRLIGVEGSLSVHI